MTSVRMALVKDTFGRGQIREHYKIPHFQRWIKIHGCFWAEHCCFFSLAIDVGQLTDGRLIEFIPLLNA